jgi:hypothetical protein
LQKSGEKKVLVTMLIRKGLISNYAENGESNKAEIFRSRLRKSDE